MTSKFGLSQIIKEATHILESSFSWIDLIFTTQPNVVVESGVHPSLHPPSYPWEIWHYQQENTELIRRAITDFNWDRAFLNTNVNERICIFSNAIINNILRNFIPHETVVCDDQATPWFNKAIKSLIQEKKTHSINTTKEKITTSNNKTSSRKAEFFH